MNKRGLFGAIIFCAFVLLFISLMAVGTYSNEKAHSDFCKGHGFDTHEKAAFKWERSLCVKIEDDYRVEKEYGRCGNKLCFIKNDAEVSGDKQ